MQKTDYRKRDKPLYSGKQGRWDRLNIPPMTYAMITGQGDPNAPEFTRAIAALYPLAYGVKALAKAQGNDFVMPPLSALWTADDPSAFVSGDRTLWKWTAMIRLPDDTSPDRFETARGNVLTRLARKKQPATDASTLQAITLGQLNEGTCLQTLHIGPYTDEAPVLAELHDRLMPNLGLTFGGAHHEIYLSDPRRVAPEKLKTILRQPVLAT